jgi:hypothetical protein
MKGKIAEGNAGIGKLVENFPIFIPVQRTSVNITIHDSDVEQIEKELQTLLNQKLINKKKFPVLCKIQSLMKKQNS